MYVQSIELRINFHTGVTRCIIYIGVETMCNTIVIHREFHKYRFSMFLYTLNPTTTLTTSLFINSFRILCNVPCVYMCIYIAVHPELVYKLNEAGTSTCISHQ